MKQFLILLLTVTIILCCVSGCSSGTDVFFSCDDFTQQQNLGAEVTVSPGETVTVTLCSNASTGFAWGESAAIADSTVLEQTGHKFIAPGESKPGASGQQEWTFKALKKGTTTAYMEYSRPWEGGEKGVWKFTLTVIVK